MATQWLRRAWLAAACGIGLALAGCGSGSIESQLSPARIVVFGDAFADLGQNGARYTVNDNSVNNWTQWVADAFGRPLAPSNAGGTSYAIAHARVEAKPDAVGNPATPTVKEQIDGFLAADAFGPEDLVIVNVGIGDVIVQGRAVLDGQLSREDALENATQAGRALGAQVRRLVDAGASHVVVVGPYNLGRSAWMRHTPNEGLLEAISSRFNERMLVSIVDLGQHVLYVDAALYFNLVTSSPASYDLNNGEAPACISVDPGPGIGIGNGEVNSSMCHGGTIAAGADPNYYLFADRIYPTGRGHRLFGEYAFNRIRERW